MRYLYERGMRRDRVMHIERFTPDGRGTFRPLCWHRPRGGFDASINAPWALGRKVCVHCRQAAARIRGETP